MAATFLMAMLAMAGVLFLVRFYFAISKESSWRRRDHPIRLSGRSAWWRNGVVLPFQPRIEGGRRNQKLGG